MSDSVAASGVGERSGNRFLYVWCLGERRRARAGGGGGGGGGLGDGLRRGRGRRGGVRVGRGARGDVQVGCFVSDVKNRAWALCERVSQGGQGSEQCRILHMWTADGSVSSLHGDGDEGAV